MTFAPQKDELTGTINSVISRDIVKGVWNDGDNTYLTIRQEARNALPLSSESSTLIVPLTNPNVDFVQFDKSFIRINATVNFKPTGYAAASGADNADATKNIFVFLGLKNSTDCIGEYAVYHKGKQVSGTLQSNGTVESFLYHTYRSESDLMNKTGIHSIAEQIQKYDYLSSCGEYISLSEIQTKAGGTFGINFQFDIPFTDILIFQQFKSYPAALFGDLEIRFKFNPNAFVSLNVHPIDSLKKISMESESAPVKKLGNEFEIYAKDYTKEYTQLGDTFKGIIHAKIETASGLTSWLANSQGLTISTGDVKFDYSAISITDCYSVIVGFRAKPEALERMRSKFEKNPWVKFSQNVNYLQFSQQPSTTGLNITQQVYLNNTTDFAILFPTTAHEAGGTVFKNPMLTDLAITAMNRRYPEVGLDTCSPEFIHLMLNSSRGTPRKEYANSLCYPRWKDDGEYGSDCDLTSFVATLKVERPSAMGLICDGLDSKGYQVPIRLQATRKYTGEHDAYCKNATSMPPPILITVNDSYFIFNAKDGGQCIYSNRPFNETVSTFMRQ